MEEDKLTTTVEPPEFYYEYEPKNFFDKPEWLTNRDSKGRAKTTNVKKMLGDELHSDHLMVIEAELTEEDTWIDGTTYAAGTVWKVDGHSRPEVWENPYTNVGFDDVKKLAVLRYKYPTLREIEAVYYRINSADSSENTKDIYKGFYKSYVDENTGQPWQWQSSKFKGGNISMLMEYAASKLFSHRFLSVKAAKASHTETVSKVKIGIRRRQMDQFVNSMRVLDHFIRTAELNKTPKIMTDNPMTAALMGFFWSDGAENYSSPKEYILHMNHHVRELIEDQLVPMNFLKDKDQNNEVHMNFAGNRLIRDASTYDNSKPRDSIFQPTIPDRSKSGGAGLAYDDALCDILKIANSGIHHQSSPVVDTQKAVDKWIAKTTVRDQEKWFSNPENQKMVSNLVISGFMPSDDDDVEEDEIEEEEE